MRCKQVRYLKVYEVSTKGSLRVEIQQTVYGHRKEGEEVEEHHPMQVKLDLCSAGEHGEKSVNYHLLRWKVHLLILQGRQRSLRGMRRAGRDQLAVLNA